ncbi:MAG: hypothetical protein ACREEE_08305 [Dongiaceae bacterium]
MVINPNNFDITWEPVTDPIRPDLGPVTIGGYQVIVEQVAPLRVLLIDLPVNVCTATLCSVQIPSEFFVQPNTLHKFEVLVIETGGNQTITSGEFLTPP